MGQKASVTRSDKDAPNKINKDKRGEEDVPAADLLRLSFMCASSRTRALTDEECNAKRTADDLHFQPNSRQRLRPRNEKTTHLRSKSDRGLCTRTNGLHGYEYDAVFGTLTAKARLTSISSLNSTISCPLTACTEFSGVSCIIHLLYVVCFGRTCRYSVV